MDLPPLELWSASAGQSKSCPMGWDTLTAGSVNIHRNLREHTIQVLFLWPNSYTCTPDINTTGPILCTSSAYNNPYSVWSCLSTLTYIGPLGRRTEGTPAGTHSKQLVDSTRLGTVPRNNFRCAATSRHATFLFHMASLRNILGCNLYPYPSQPRRNL